MIVIETIKIIINIIIIRTHANMYEHTHIRTHTHACTHVQIYALTCASAHACMHARTDTHACTYGYTRLASTQYVAHTFHTCADTF